MKALFVGLTTIDLIYQVEQAPQANQKSVAQDFSLAAGGPATNAAVTFAALQERANRTTSAQQQSERNAPSAMVPTLVTCLGQHPLAHVAHRELQTCGVTVLDLAPDVAEPPPMSSIWVHAATGDRTVVSLNATRIPAQPEMLPPSLLQDVAIILIDGHQMAIGEAIARQAQQQNIPVVIDGGSWKPGFERVLRYADVVIASANFFPPNTATQADVVTYLQSLGVERIAITDGADAIAYWERDRAGSVAVLKIQTIDTLGAGDIFHGAFCHYWQLDKDFSTALARATEIAALACQSFGTRAWLKVLSCEEDERLI